MNSAPVYTRYNLPVAISAAEIKPAFGERNLPVVMVVDGNYILYLKVVLRSILASTRSRNVDVIVLHAGLGRQLLDEAMDGFEGGGVCRSGSLTSARLSRQSGFRNTGRATT